MDQKTKVPREWREIHPHKGAEAESPEVAAGLLYLLLHLIQELGQKSFPTPPTQGKDSGSVTNTNTALFNTTLFKATPAAHLRRVKGCQLSVLRGRWESIPGNQLTLPSWSQRRVCRVADVGHTQDRTSRESPAIGPRPPSAFHIHTLRVRG